MLANGQKGLKDVLLKNGPMCLNSIRKWKRIDLIVTCFVMIILLSLVWLGRGVIIHISCMLSKLQILLGLLSLLSIEMTAGCGLIIICNEKKSYCIWPWPDALRKQSFFQIIFLRRFCSSQFFYKCEWTLQSIYFLLYKIVNILNVGLQRYIFPWYDTYPDTVVVSRNVMWLLIDKYIFYLLSNNMDHGR